MCPKGSISGPGVKVGAELARPAGLLFTMFLLRIIMKFSGVNNIDKSDVYAQDQDQRSKVKVTEVKRNFTELKIWVLNHLHKVFWGQCNAENCFEQSQSART